MKKKSFSVYWYRYNVMHTKSWVLLSNYSNFASGKICNVSYLFQKSISWWFSSKHFFLDTCHMIAFYSIIWMYSGRIHLVLFIVHSKQHKGLHSLSPPSYWGKYLSFIQYFSISIDHSGQSLEVCQSSCNNVNVLFSHTK